MDQDVLLIVPSMCCFKPCVSFSLCLSFTKRIESTFLYLQDSYVIIACGFDCVGI